MYPFTKPCSYFDSVSKVATLAIAGLVLNASVLLNDAMAGVPLVIGSVEEDVEGERQRYRAFIDYLSKQLASTEVDDVKLTVFTSIDDMAAAINRSQVDIYIDSPVLATIVSRKAEAEPFLRVWKEGVAAYSTVIYAKRSSGLSNLSDLKGKVIAFRKRESTPGHYLPRSYISSTGIPLVELDSPKDPVPAGSIGYVFSHGSRTGLAWVQKGLVAASVMKDSAFEGDDLSSMRLNLSVLGRTDSVPRQVMVRRSDIDPEIVAHLERVLVEMSDNEQGAAALQAMDETLKIDAFPNGAAADMAEVGKMLDAVQGAN